MKIKFFILSVILAMVSSALVVMVIVCINIMNERKDIEQETNISQSLTDVQLDTVKVEYNLQTENLSSPPTKDDQEDIVSAKLLERFKESYDKNWRSFYQEGDSVYSNIYMDNGNVSFERVFLFTVNGRLVDVVPNSQEDALLYSTQSDDGSKTWYVYDLILKENTQLNGLGFISFGDPVAYGMAEEFKWVGNEVNLISAVGKFHYCEKSFGYIYDLVQKQVVEIRNIPNDCTMPETSFEQ